MPADLLSTIFDRLEKTEQLALQKEFLSPYLQGAEVRLRIAGVIVTLRVPTMVLPPPQGWGVFRPLGYDRAAFVRLAHMEERERYLQLFPAIRMLVAEVGDSCYGVLANHDTRVGLTGTATIQLAEEVQLFDTVVTRFDGTQFWFDSPDERRNTRFADELRAQATELKDYVSIPGATLEERELYGRVLVARRREATLAAEEAHKQTAEYRIAAALEHSGGKLRSYIERPDGYTVEYTVGNERHVSAVDKNLRVRSAGICLSGGDSAFDLTSLVCVLRHAHRTGRIYRVGDNLEDDDD